MDFEVFEIDINYLENYQSPTWNKDDLYFSDDKNFATYFYNINEYRMLSYASEFAIFEKNNSKPIFNFKKNPVWYSLKNPVQYFNKSKCFVLKKMMGNHIPFLFIKPFEKKFAVLKFDWSSIYFNLKEINTNVFKIKAQDIEEVKRLNLDFLENGFVDLSKLIWYDFNEFKNFESIYKNL